MVKSIQHKIYHPSHFFMIFGLFLKKKQKKTPGCQVGINCSGQNGARAEAEKWSGCCGSRRETAGTLVCRKATRFLEV